MLLRVTLFISSFENFLKDLNNLSVYVPIFSTAKYVLDLKLNASLSRKKMLESEIPFEIHITTEALAPSRHSDFLGFCNKWKAKPILIELSKGDFQNQPMFSKVVYSNRFDKVLKISSDISASMETCRFLVKRLKIEVPSRNWKHFQDFQTKFEKYFEWHCKVNLINKSELLKLCKKHKVHLSKNSLRNEADIRFITLREFGKNQNFEKRVSELSKDLHMGLWTILKQQSEYCIYDNNEYLDNGWLPQ